MADFKLSRFKCTWRGEWSSITKYNPDDIVNFGALVYVCLTSHTSNTDFYSDLNAINGDIPPLAIPRWQLMVTSARWTGDWQTEYDYVIGDIAKYSGISYICTAPHTSSALVSGFYEELTHWTVLISTETWFSTWLPVTYYKLNDVVRFGGRVYRCNLPHLSAGGDNPTLESSIANWDVVSISDNWTGNWQTSTLYKTNDFVKYNGRVYRCTIGHVSTQNIEEGIPYDIANWVLIYDGIQYRGDWQATTLYYPNDIIKFGGYIYKKNNVLEVSGTFFNSTQWEIYSPGVEFETAWSPLVQYNKGDIVRYGGNIYATTEDIFGSALTPGVEPGVNSAWTLLFENSRMRGEWTSAIQYRPGDVVRRGGNLYVAILKNTFVDPDTAEDGSSTNSTYWQLIITGTRWRGIWDTDVTYITGDTVLWISSTFKCVDKHVSDATNRPDDDPLIGMGTEAGAGDSTLTGRYWIKITEGSAVNRLRNRGDLRTFGLDEDGSTVGFTNISVGNVGQAVVASSTNNASWIDLNQSNRVYYVSLTGVDEETQGGSPNATFRTIRYACDYILADQATRSPATIFVRTGVFEEILPIRIPAFVGIVGDELRSTVVAPANQVLSTAYLNTLSSASAYIQDIAGFIIQEIQVGADDPVDPTTVLYGTVPQDFSGSAASPGEVLAIKSLLELFESRITTFNSQTPTSTNNVTAETFKLNAAAQLVNNKSFILNEVTLYLETTAAFVPPARWNQDINALIDAVIYDLRYTGNYKTYELATYFINANSYNRNKIQNMFLLRDGTGLRNMTLRGLSGTLTPAQTQIEYVYQRPTAGAYASLDPGWGVGDTTAWVGTKSPYVQNVTTFGTGCVGLKVDGDLHAGGNQTIVCNDFTQILSDGIGIWCNSAGRSEAVSVFTYYNHIGYLCTAGGKIRGTNGNCSYGKFGAISIGSSAGENPITATVNNRYYEADVSQVLCSNGQIKKFFFSNAGTTYTQATMTLAGAGINASILVDEFRDGGTYEVRITDPGDSSNAGGAGYTFTTNSAQSGNSRSIQLAGSDSAERDVYIGMRVYISAGLGVGQYGYVADFDDAGKYAYVATESTPSITVLSTSSSGNTVTLNSSPPESVKVGDPVIFSSTDDSQFGNIQPLTVYYIKSLGSNVITLSLDGSDLDPVYFLINGSNALSNMTIHFLGWENVIPGTPIESTLDGTTVYYVEPRVSFTSPGFTTTAAALPANKQWTSITRSADKFFASALDINYVGVSTNGEAWSQLAGLPETANWNKIKFVGGVLMIFGADGEAARSTDNGVTWSAMTMPLGLEYRDVAYGNSVWIAVPSGSATYARSTNGGVSWTSAALPEGADWNSITYGKGKFVAVALSDSSIVDTVYSTDGTNWTAGSTGIGAISVTYGNGRYVAIAGGTALSIATAISFDGITWITGTLPSTLNWQQVTYGQGLFVAVASGTNVCATSDDGVNWTTQNIGTSATWAGVVFAPGVSSLPGKFVAISGSSVNSTSARIINTGVTTKARATVVSGRISEFNIWEPGSGYSSSPIMSITDPNNSSEVATLARIGNGVLASPTILNAGTGWATTSTSATIIGDGYKDQYHLGSDLIINNLSRLPGPGDNLRFASINDYTYKLLAVTILSGTFPNVTARISVAKDINRGESPEHDEAIQIRQLYSQVRLTGHDFLDIGLGNFEQTNYPDVLNPIGTIVSPEQEVQEKEGGRVFYTSTDQDGNFRVGELFAVEQSTGTVTLNAQFFELQGLEELTLGGVTVGGSGVVIREFSTDSLMVADSNNIISTQAAIKAYITRRVSGGGADAITGSLTAGVTKIGPDTIENVTGEETIFTAKVNFKGGIDGDWLTHSMFLSSGV